MKERTYHKALLFHLFCIILFLSSCQKTPVQPGVSLQEVLTEYDSPENINVFTATADGTVFLIGLDISTSTYWLYQYNTEGECTRQYSLEPYSLVESIAVSEDGGNIYFTGQRAPNGMDLLSLNLDTGEIAAFYNFPYFAGIKKIVSLGGRIYVLGQQEQRPLSQEVSSDYNFAGKEMLVYYSFDTDEAYRLGFEYPINIAGMENGHLMVLGQLSGSGYSLMEYDPQADSMQIRQTLESYKFDNFALCNSDKSVLYGYLSNQHGLVMSDFDNFTMEVEIYEHAEQFFATRCIAYAGGRVYCKDSLTGKLVGFPLDQVQRQNKEIHMILTDDHLALSPYGCGYVLNRMAMSWNQIVLKMLAQDRNFELCMGASDYNSSQVLRDSNSFYALNDVPGVEEYLDRCFPYIREAATKDGMIWMLPFAVWTPMLLVQEDILAQEGIALGEDMTFVEFANLMEGLSDRQRSNFYFLPYADGRAFVRQYLSQHTTLLDGPFLETIQSLSLLNQGLLRVGTPTILACMEDAFGMYPELDAYYISQHEGMGAAVYSLPRGSREDKNIMTCYFLAVNPNSDRLQEALSYIADLAGYLSGRTDLFYFEEYNAIPGSLTDQIHEQFRDGEIPFTIDWDVYGPGFEEMLYGEISAEEYLNETERKMRFYFGE